MNLKSDTYNYKIYSLYFLSVPKLSYIVSQNNEKLANSYDSSPIILRTQDWLPIKFIRDGVYELRIEYNSNIYRVFFIFDEDKIVVLFNGFHKKTQKTPQNEIIKAIKIKEEYYEYKRQQNQL